MQRPTGKSSSYFPGRLRAARRKRDLSQGELAMRAQMQTSAISHFETGTRKPSFDNLRRLADALEVTTDYLLGRVKDTGALAGPDKLYRHFNRLSSDDQDKIEDFVKLLANKTRRSKQSE